MHLFFGRDEEVEILRNLVLTQRVVLLYAQSGAGKSSLLRAGLHPSLTAAREVGRGKRRREVRDMAVLPITGVGSAPPRTIERAIPNIFVYSALATLLPGRPQAELASMRIAAALGNSKVIKGLGSVKTNLDSGAFQPIQYAAMTALEASQECVAENNRIYSERRDVLIDGLIRLGWGVEKTQASFYVWIECPNGYKSSDLTALLIKETGVVTTPGVGFGASGEGYIRMTLTTSKERLAEFKEITKYL